MFGRRKLATFLSLLFIVAALAPLASVTADSWTQGNVIINGRFADPTPVGHPQKFYCDPYSGAIGAPEPTGECAGANAFVAFDWTAPTTVAANVSVAEGGLQLLPSSGVDSTFIQQHFNGTNGPDTLMQFYGVTITGKGLSAAASLRVDVRYGAGESPAGYKSARVNLGTSSSTVYLAPGDFTLNTNSPFGVGETQNFRSLRIWLEGSSGVLLENVQMHAVTTNPLNTFAPSVDVGGDDVLTVVGDAVVHGPGADGKYTWLVRAVDDLGQTQPVEDAVLCVYHAEGYVQDGFSSVGGTCPSSIAGSAQAAPYKSAVGDGTFRFDIPASLVKGEGQLPAGFYVWTSLEIDGTQHGVHASNDVWRPGFYNIAQLAAIDAGHGATAFDWDQMPTPVLFDRDSDGTPDFVQVSDADGYSVIVRAELATETPAATVVTTDVNNLVWFNVQVYKYDGALGAPIDLAGVGIDLGVFDGSGLTHPDDPKWIDHPLYTTDEGPVTRQHPDAQTIRFGIPASELPANTPLGVWAYANLNGESRHTAFSPFFGAQSGGTTDFYSVVRTAARESVAADAMRTLATPIVLDAASYTRDATLVIRANAEADDLTPLDGTLVVGDKGDGSITFEYAMVLPEGRTNAPASGSHAIAVYDAAGYASEQGQIGASGMRHALWTGQGTLVDGWYRADIPLSAFEKATGPVGIWAYVDDVHADYTISRSGFYNYVKPVVASVSTTAAEKALYVATPVVALDAALGIPLALESAINAAPGGLLSVANPVVNPGFEANLFVEGGIDNRDDMSAQMTAPPWFFRLDDKNGGVPGQATKPASTHRVLVGGGQLGTNALEIAYNRGDFDKGLMLGQLLGTPDGSDGLVWLGAKSVTFDVKVGGSTPVGLGAAIRYLDAADGTPKFKSASIGVTSAQGWYKANLPVGVPADAKLLGLYLEIESTSSQTILIDNVAIKGSKTTLGDARSDLSDGFATIIEPRALTSAAQDAFEGADGSYYLYDVSFVDYTGVEPSALDLEGRARTFALRTNALETTTGTILQKRGTNEAFVAVVGVGEEPAPLAVPWAWTEAGEVYQTFFVPEDQQSASGYYNPVKNALKGSAIADQLDYGATPIALRGDPAGSLVAPQVLRFAAVPGGYGVYVDADSEFIETTTVTLSYPAGSGETGGAYGVVLATDNDNRVPGVLLSAQQLELVTATSADTLFTTGASIAPGTPIPMFEVCRVASLPTACSDQNIKSNDGVRFQSTSTAPNGEPLLVTWDFGDGETDQGAIVTHAFDGPGAYSVTMTVTSQSGKSATITKVVGVGNVAPIANPVNPLRIMPTAVYRDTQPVAAAFFSDSDGGSLTYAWTIEGMGIAGATTSGLRITPAILAGIGFVDGLEKGQTYVVGVTAYDGQGGSTGPVTRSFTVGDHAAVASAPAVSVVGLPSATYAIAGETLKIQFEASDSDNETLLVELGVAGASWATAIDTVQVSPGVYAAEWTTTDAETLRFEAIVDGVAASAEVAYEVVENSLPTLALSGPALVQAFETGVYNASAVDPDNRMISYAWTLDGQSVAATTAFSYATSAASVGEHTIEVTVSDGIDSVTETLDVAVDDVLLVTLSTVSEAEEVTDGHILRVKVTDVYGTPLVNHPVRVDDFYDPLPRAMETKNLRTDANGEAVFRLPPEAAGVLGLPLTHRVVATATAGSVAGAPVDDAETGIDTMVFQNVAGPYAGLPLP